MNYAKQEFLRIMEENLAYHQNLAKNTKQGVKLKHHLANIKSWEEKIDHYKEEFKWSNPSICDCPFTDFCHDSRQRRREQFREKGYESSVEECDFFILIYDDFPDVDFDKIEFFKIMDKKIAYHQMLVKYTKQSVKLKHHLATIKSCEEEIDQYKEEEFK